MNLSMSLVKVNYALIMNYHWYKTSLLPQAVLCDVQRFYCQKVCAIEGPVLYPYKNAELCMVLFHIRIFSVLTLQFCITLHYFSMWLTSAWVICMSQ